MDDGVTQFNELMDPVEELRELEQEMMVADLQALEDVLNAFEKFALQGDETREKTFELNTL